MMTGIRQLACCAMLAGLSAGCLGEGTVTGHTNAAADAASTDTAADATPCSPGAVTPCRQCQGGVWQSEPAGTPCDDGNACTLGDQCQAGACQAGAAKDCDDGTPCTLDGCDPVHGCQWLPVAATCTDNNPCTVEEHCDAGECKSKPKSCDDGNPCTDDHCNTKTGACYGHSNGHESCIPTFAQVSIPWAAEVAGPLSTAELSGTVTSNSGSINTVTVNGQPVVLSASGTFSVQVPLAWGSNDFVIAASDSSEGTNVLLRATRFATNWRSPALDGIQVLQALAAGSSFDPKNLNWSGISQPALWVPNGPIVAVQVAADLAATVTASLANGIEPDTPDLGVPVRSSCPGANSIAPLATGKSQLWLSFDLLNALLWANWRAGGLHGDLAPVLDNPIFKEFKVSGQAVPPLPPLLQDCPTPTPRVHIDAFRLDMAGTDPKDAPGAPQVTGSIWLSWDAAVTVTCQDGQLLMKPGRPEHIASEIHTTSLGTNLVGLLRNLLVDLAVPKLGARWAKVGLLRAPLPAGWTGRGVQCQLVAGGVLVSKGL